jgi:predicted XRE-type DNA-binding protein
MKKVKKRKSYVAHNAEELAQVLGLSPADAVEIEVRSKVNNMIIKVVDQQGLTHAEVAKLSGTSRSRVTAILNRNTQDVSTDLMLRILACLGYKAKIRFVHAA